MPEYSKDTHDKVIQISFWKAISIVASAVLVSIVGTAFTIANRITSDHYVLVRAVDDITQLRANSISRTEVDGRLSRIEEDLKEIKTDLKSLRR